MVDVTDAAFRSVAKDWGADVTCSEMVSAAAIVHDNVKAWRYVEPWPGEDPYGVQLMTGDPEEMASAVKALGSKMKMEFLDINLGCPAPNILKSCAGGFLLRDPQKAGQVIRAAVKAAEEVGIPRVTAKMRLGPDERRHTYIEVAKEAEAAGCAWVTLHARTVEQGYSGQADWSHIRRLVEAVDIPVIGNGDLREPEDVVRMRAETGCAGFFIARAAMRDPTVFRRMRQALDGKALEASPPLNIRAKALLEYMDRAATVGITAMPDLRRQAARFVQGSHGAAKMRARFQDATTPEELRALTFELTSA